LGWCIGRLRLAFLEPVVSLRRDRAREVCAAHPEIRDPNRPRVRVETTPILPAGPGEDGKEQWKNYMLVTVVKLRWPPLLKNKGRYCLTNGLQHFPTSSDPIAQLSRISRIAQ
jgi:hypothetical protein